MASQSKLLVWRDQECEASPWLHIAPSSSTFTKHWMVVKWRFSLWFMYAVTQLRFCSTCMLWCLSMHSQTLHAWRQFIYLIFLYSFVTFCCEVTTAWPQILKKHRQYSMHKKSVDYIIMLVINVPIYISLFFRVTHANWCAAYIKQSSSCTDSNRWFDQ